MRSSLFNKIFALTLSFVSFNSDIANAFVRGGGAQSSVAAASFTPAWQALRMGAGGKITNIQRVLSDGTMVIRTDTYNGYMYRGTGTCLYGTTQTFAAPCWEGVFSATSLPSALVNANTSNNGNNGAAELIVCESNTNVAYAIFHATVLVTTNLQSTSRTWVDTGQASAFNANNSTKTKGPYIACDPNNPDVVYVSTPSGGVVRSTNGRSGASATFSAVPTVTNSGGNGSLIVINPASSTTTCSGVTCTSEVMICSPGVNCWLSTNASTWSAISSSPTSVSRLIIDKFNQYWAANSTNLQRYASGAWSTLSIPGGGFNVQAVASDPTSSAIGSNHVAFSSASGQIGSTSDNGSTWTPAFCCASQSYTATGSEPGWMGGASQASAGVTSDDTDNIVFDGSANLWKAAGIGVWIATAPVSGSTNTWAARSVGIEQLVVQNVISGPGLPPISNVWDRGVFLIQNPDVYPSSQYTQSTSIHQIQGAWRADWAGSAGFVTACVASNLDGTSAPAKSTDGGNTWTAWSATNSSTQACQVWAASSSNWIGLPKTSDFGGVIAYSTGTGPTSWTNSTIGSPGGAAGFNTSIGGNDFANRVFGAADRVNGNFYLVDNAQNFYKSTNGGANFTATGATSASVDGVVYRDQMFTVPGQANNLFYTSGGGQNGTHPQSGHLWKSTDGGATWAKSPSSGALQEVVSMGFGAAKPGGGGYPMVYAYGWLSSVQGLYQSEDGGTTWSIINVPTSEKTWPMNSVDLITSVSGDYDVYGRIYVGFAGSGNAYIDIPTACPWVKFTSTTKPNDSKTGTISLAAQASGRSASTITSVNFYVDGSLIGSQTSGTGTPTTYTQSWNTGGVATGAHTLKVEAVGNGCTAGGGGNAQSIPITTF